MMTIHGDTRPSNFNEWMIELRAIAEKHGAGFIVSDDDEDHRESYNDGDTPLEEFREQCAEAARACS